MILCLTLGLPNPLIVILGSELRTLLPPFPEKKKHFRTITAESRRGETRGKAPRLSPRYLATRPTRHPRQSAAGPAAAVLCLQFRAPQVLYNVKPDLITFLRLTPFAVFPVNEDVNAVRSADEAIASSDVEAFDNSRARHPPFHAIVAPEHQNAPRHAPTPIKAMTRQTTVSLDT